MLEVDFNRSLRGTMRLQGLSAIHIKEADDPGVVDLVVYMGSLLLAWVELKIDDEPLRPGQVEFMRKHDRDTGNVFLIRLYGNTGVLSIERPVVAGEWSVDNKKHAVLHRTADQNFDWARNLARWKRGSRHRAVAV